MDPPAPNSASHSERVDRALWAAVRTLEEQAAVANFRREMAQRRGDAAEAGRFGSRSAQAAEQATTLREMVLRMDPAPA